MRRPESRALAYAGCLAVASLWTACAAPSAQLRVEPGQSPAVASPPENACAQLPRDLPRRNPFSTCLRCHRADEVDAPNLYFDDPKTLRAALSENPWFATDIVERVRARLDPSSPRLREHPADAQPPYFMPPRAQLSRADADAIAGYVSVLTRDRCRR